MLGPNKDDWFWPGLRLYWQRSTTGKMHRHTHTYMDTAGTHKVKTLTTKQSWLVINTNNTYMSSVSSFYRWPWFFLVCHYSLLSQRYWFNRFMSRNHKLTQLLRIKLLHVFYLFFGISSLVNKVVSLIIFTSILQQWNPVLIINDNCCQDKAVIQPIRFDVIEHARQNKWGKGLGQG